MRIARFAVGGDPQYGIVELAGDGGKNPDTVSTLSGDPIAMPVQLTGERRPFPAHDPRFGLPKRDDLAFVVLEKKLQAADSSI